MYCKYVYRLNIETRSNIAKKKLHAHMSTYAQIYLPKTMMGEHGRHQGLRGPINIIKSLLFSVKPAVCCCVYMNNRKEITPLDTPQVWAQLGLRSVLWTKTYDATIVKKNNNLINLKNLRRITLTTNLTMLTFIK